MTAAWGASPASAGMLGPSALLAPLHARDRGVRAQPPCPPDMPTQCRSGMPPGRTPWRVGQAGRPGRRIWPQSSQIRVGRSSAKARIARCPSTASRMRKRSVPAFSLTVATGWGAPRVTASRCNPRQTSSIKGYQPSSHRRPYATAERTSDCSIPRPTSRRAARTQYYEAEGLDLPRSRKLHWRVYERRFPVGALPGAFTFSDSAFTATVLPTSSKVLAILDPSSTAASVQAGHSSWSYVSVPFA